MSTLAKISSAKRAVEKAKNFERKCVQRMRDAERLLVRAAGKVAQAEKHLYKMRQSFMKKRTKK